MSLSLGRSKMAICLFTSFFKLDQRVNTIGLIMITPGSTNRVFNNFFRRLEGVILGVFGTIWECSEATLGGNLGYNPGRKPFRSSQRDFS